MIILRYSPNQGGKKMNIIDKFLALRFRDTYLKFKFEDSPIKSSQIFNDSRYRASGTNYWVGKIVDHENTPIIGKDCKLLLRVNYTFLKKSHDPWTLSDTCKNLPGNYFSDTNVFTLRVSDLILSSADEFIQDRTFTRNDKTIGKNYIHFSTKSIEGYLEFSDYAIEKSFKKYLLSLYSEKDSCK